MKLSASLLILSETVFGLRHGCAEDDLVKVQNGSWNCEATDNERGQVCEVKCNDGFYLQRPGPVGRRARCKQTEFDSKKWIYPDDAEAPEFKCLAGCDRSIIDGIDIENGGWHCPLHDDTDTIIGSGHQCFARCNEPYELYDSNGHYSMRKFSKVCKCSEDNNRCHWARTDNVPICKAPKTNRIINGHTAEANSKPYMVSISVKTKTGGKNGNKKKKVMVHYCGGVLIHPQWVVTAAHCKKRGMTAILGEHDLRVAEGTEKNCRISKTIQHPHYNQQTKHDIMLAQIKCNIKSSKYITPALLPPANVDVKTETDCSICGWGNMAYPDFKPAEKLQCVNLPVIGTNTCNKGYRGAIHDHIMCIGLMKGGKDSCQGDSGGPAICDGRVHGIVMGGLYCAQADYPGVYTRVSHYVDWIKGIIRSH